jgi:hypothetical protein
MDAPFFCTDLRNPEQFNTGFGNQWGVGSTVDFNKYEHITIWPKGIHALNERNDGSGEYEAYDNWMACMMTSWAAGHPMSVSAVFNGVRKWIPLIYTGPLQIGGSIKSVAIDLGAAIIIELTNRGLNPFGSFPNDHTPYMMSANFTGSYSIGMSPITFRHMPYNINNDCLNGFMSGQQSLVSYINFLIEKYGTFNPGGYSEIIETWSEYGKTMDDATEGTLPGSGLIFMTWSDINKDDRYVDTGVLVCTAIPNIINIQQQIIQNQ